MKELLYGCEHYKSKRVNEFWGIPSSNGTKPNEKQAMSFYLGFSTLNLTKPSEGHVRIKNQFEIAHWAQKNSLGSKELIGLKRTHWAQKYSLWAKGTHWAQKGSLGSE